MRRLAFALWLAAAPASAMECGGVDLSADPTVKPNWGAYSAELENAEGLLWRIDKPGLAPSYLYGTMHSTMDGPMRLERDAQPYAEKATVIATELGALDAKRKIDMGAQMLREALSPDADTFKGYLEGEEARHVEDALAAKGTLREMAHHMKLWMLAVVASLPKCELEGQAKGLPEVDETLADAGLARKIPVIGLETVEEQTRALEAIPDDLAAATLRSSTRGGALADGGYKTLLSLYEQKQPAKAVPMLLASPGVSEAERATTWKLMRLLLQDRNAVMAERSAPWLAKGGAFIAVGALHLSGHDGLVARFRGLGYDVSKVW